MNVAKDGSQRDGATALIYEDNRVSKPAPGQNSNLTATVEDHLNRQEELLRPSQTNAIPFLGSEIARVSHIAVDRLMLTLSPPYFSLPPTSLTYGSS